MTVSAALIAELALESIPTRPETHLQIVFRRYRGLACSEIGGSQLDPRLNL